MGIALEAHELKLLNTRLSFIEPKLAEMDDPVGHGSGKNDFDVYDTFSTLQSLIRLSILSGSLEGTLRAEKEIIVERIRRIKSRGRIPSSIYDYGEQEYNSLNAVIRTLDSLYQLRR